MKWHTLELVGQTHEMSGDSHYTRVIPGSQDEDWYLFMVADGLTDYSGTTASNLAVKTIGSYLEQELLKGEKETPLIIGEGIAEANELLAKKGGVYTTLSLILLSSRYKDNLAPEEFYVANVGDSQGRLIYDQKCPMITTIPEKDLDENQNKPGETVGQLLLTGG